MQEENEMVVVFPAAYHLSFDHGHNLTESANFATDRWVDVAMWRLREGSPFDLTPVVKKHRPHLLQKWTDGHISPPEGLEEADSDEGAEEPNNDEDYFRWVEERREEAREDLFRFAHGRVEARYDYKNGRLHCPLAMTAEEDREFERWKRNYRKTFDVYHVASASGGQRIRVDREGGCKRSTMRRLRSILNLPETGPERGLKELLADGRLQKVGTEVRFVPETYYGKDVEKGMKTLKEQQSKAHILVEEKTAFVYRHVMENHIEALVDPETKNILGVTDAVPELSEILKVMSMSELIGCGVMRRAGERRVRITKHVQVKESPSGSHKQEVEVYSHTSSTKKVFVGPKSRRVLGELPNEAKSEVEAGRATVDDVLRRGDLLKYQGREFITVTAKEEEKEKSEESEEKGECLEYIYWLKKQGIEVRLHPKSGHLLAIETCRYGHKCFFLILILTYML